MSGFSVSLKGLWNPGKSSGGPLVVIITYIHHIFIEMAHQ